MEVPSTANSEFIGQRFGRTELELFQGDSYSMFWNSDTLGAASLAVNPSDHEDG